jgi:hypothetical protein
MAYKGFAATNIINHSAIDYNRRYGILLSDRTNKGARNMNKKSKFAIFSPTTTSEDLTVYVGSGDWEYVNTNSHTWLNNDVGVVLFETEHEANIFVSKYNIDDCQVEKVGNVLAYWENN